MTVPASFRRVGFGRSPAASKRVRAAQAVLGICATVDALAEEADAVLDVDDDHLFSLLEQREQMLVDLADYVVALKLERPTADSPLYAASEKVVDDADALITEVSAALAQSNRTTMALALRVEERVMALRAELAEVQRAGSARVGYGTVHVSHQMDRRR